MKNITLVIALIMFSSCVTFKVTAREQESLANEKFQSGHYPHHIHPNMNWPFRGPLRVLPRISAGHYFRPTPFQEEVSRCLSDKREVRTCFEAKTFFTRKAAVGSECCAAVKKMNEDCEKVFGSLHYPFINSYVKLYCSTVVGSTSPAPSLADSPVPSLAHSPVPSPANSPAPSPSLSLAPSPADSPSLSLAPSPALSPADSPSHSLSLSLSLSPA